MKKTLNKMLAMLLAIVMIVGLFGTQAFAATGDNSVQIVDEGGSNPADGSLNADGVAISKTIAPTEDENFFDITLTVTTTEKIEEIYQAQDMAVVVVMDISNTMTSTFGSSTRYQAAMEAAEQFINSFAAYSNGVTVARKIGYVAFNTDAHQIFGLSDCKTTAQAAGLISSMKDKTGKIINASGYSASHSRFTNIEAGLKMGYDLLKDSGVENQYIIFLSDGFPTTYVKSGYTGYDPYDANGTRFKNNKTGLPCVFGTSYSDEAATRAQNMAATIEASGVKIFSIGVDVGGQTIAKYEEQDAKNAKSGFSVIDCYGKNTPYVIGNSVDGFKTWLKDSIGSGYYYDSTNTAGLKEAYAKIFEEIKEINMSSVENTWVVTDTMSEVQPSVIEFLHLWTKSGTNGGSALTGSAVLNGENTASYNSSAESISWDLKNSGYTITTNGNMTHYHYSLSYRIRLENEIAGFVDSKNYATNGPTSVIYQVRVNGTLSDENTLDFPIPEVEGYLGRLEFTKVSAKDSSAVAGARFTLSHHGANCAVCDGHAVIADMTAVSGADGKVVFENIPSGHTYTLTETVTPDGYLENTETYAVEVAYGVVTLDGKTPDRISNIPVTAPGSLALSAVKYLDGAAPADGQFTFVLKENGQVIQTVTNKGSSVSFDAIEYTAIGEHTYTIEEIPGGAIDIEYDGTVYTVIVEVVEKNYELVPSVKSVIGGNDNEIVFNNETIPPANGSIKLGAVKYLDGVAPADGQFTFVLKENGQVIQTVTNNGSSVSFGAIEYTAEGTYVYTISEVAGSAVDIDYDETVYTVTVTVTRDFGTNKLVAVADKQVTEIVFNNETIPPAKGSIRLGAVKYLDGVAPADGQFTFVLKENGQVIQTVTNKGSSVSFGAIEYTAEGTYVYTISEVAGSAVDIDYDETVYTVTVTVTRDARTNRLVAVADKQVAEIVFNNETIPPAKGSIKLGAVKYLDGVAPADGRFTFVLKENGQVIQTVTNNGSSVSFGAIEYTAEGTYVYTISEVAGSAVDIDYDETVYTVTVTVTRDFGTNKLVAVADKQVTEIVFNNETIPPANGSIKLGAVKYLDGVAPADGQFTFALKENGQIIQTVTNNGSSVSFGAIEYTAEGTYVYTISEVAGSAVDIDYDETVYTVTVTVTRDFGTNKLVAVADKQVAEIVFNNETIPPAKGSIRLGAVKYLDGVAPADGQFTFVLKENGQVIQTVTNNGSSVSFGAIEYTAEGTYVYTISEVAGAAINIIYDRTVYTVVVEVSKTDNVLNASIKSISGGVDVPVFRNETIPPSAAAINLGATKLLDDKAPEGSDFTFVLKDAQGNVIESVSNDGAMVSFSTLVYDQVGTYTYTISEVEGTNWRINYDETVWTVQVQVVENGQTNELEAYVVSCTAEDGTDNGDGWPTFRNETVRILAPATIELSAIKLLDGQAPADGQFTFRLEDPYGNLLQTVTNNGSQVIFAPITYTMFGRYSYVISEVAGTDDNIIYDSARYTVVVAVKVVDDADGYRLVAEMVSIKGGPVVPVFNNITKELPPPEIPDDPPEIPDDPPEIPDDPPEVPDEPPVEDIPDDEVPLSDVPATGDFSVVWMIACGLSAAGLVGMGIRRKKEDEDQ